MNIVSLFPKAVGVFNYDKGLSKQELEYIHQQERFPNTGNTTSKDRNVLESPQFTELREFIQSSIDKYFQEVIAPDYDTRLRITQSWLNYTKPGQFHHKHAHPNSVLSAVFYIDADENTDKIYFYQDAYNQIDFKTTNWNLYNSKSWWLSVSTNKLLVFPSGLTHSVETKSGDNERISLALNTFPVGYVGDDSSLTGLHI